MHVVLCLQGVFALVERDETATCRNQNGENHKKKDSNLIFAPLFNTIALGLNHKKQEGNKKKNEKRSIRLGGSYKKESKNGGETKNMPATELRRGDNGRRRRRVRTRGL